MAIDQRTIDKLMTIDNVASLRKAIKELWEELKAHRDPASDPNRVVQRSSDFAGEMTDDEE